MQPKNSLRLFRSAYSAKERVVLDTGKETRVQQQFKDLSDVTRIVKKFNRTGEIDYTSRNAAFYADISDAKSLGESLVFIESARQSFLALPSDVRKYFDNDPLKLTEFVSDPNNYGKAAELGLLTEEKLKAYKASLAEQAESRLNEEVEKRVSKRSKNSEQT